MLNCVSTQDENTRQDDIIAKTVITEKLLAMDCLTYNYTNKYRLQKVDQPCENSVLTIKNLPCVMNGNQLKKITEIEYAGNKYYIQDFYTLSISFSSETSNKKYNQNEQSQSSSSQVAENFSKNQSKSSKKFCLFKKSKGKQKSQRRNTKNVAKNFCKAFSNYLQVEKKVRCEKERVQGCINQLKMLIGHKKYYNNRIIWEIISSNICKEHFKHFLEKHAQGWIQNSKMEYKDVHLEAIDIYSKLYQKMAFLEQDQDEQNNQQQSSFSK